MQHSLVMIVFCVTTRDLGEVFRCTKREPFAVGDTRASNDQLTHQIRGLQCDERRDEATHGEAEAVDLFNVEGSDYGDDVSGPVDEASSDCAFASTDACVVDEKDGTFCGEWVYECRIPPVHVASKVDVEEERDPSLFSEEAVRIFDPFDGDVAIFCCFVRRHVGCSLGEVVDCTWAVRRWERCVKVNIVRAWDPTFVLYV